MMKRVLALTTLVVIGGLASVYVGNTILYLTPPNPLKLQLAPMVYGLQQPWFTQNWHLFAPNPIKTNFVLAVRCRTGDQVSLWHDPFTSLLATHHRNRFTPMGKVVRIPLNATFAYLGRNSDEWLLLICKKNPDLSTCQGDHPAVKKQKEQGLYLLRRLSSASCDQFVGYGRTTAVQVQILIHTPPPISQWHLANDQGSTRYLTLPWEPYQPWTADRSQR